MRKILCILLSLITVLPIMISTKNAAHAEEDEYTVHWIYDIQSEPLSYDNGYVYSGTMVSGVTWNFDIDSGTLSVTGNGEIDDYTSPDVSGNNEGKAPWSAYRHYILNLFISSGITRIGSYAFTNCVHLTTVRLSENVEEIGKYAFSSCRNLRRIDIGNNGTTSLSVIDECAFSSCDMLESVTIPGTVKETGLGAFANCTSLKTVVINEGFEKINHNTFDGCGMLKSIVIPNSVKTICNRAFNECGSLESITLGTGLEEIQNDAFINCRRLVSVYNNSSLNIVYGSTTHGNVALYADRFLSGNIEGAKEYYSVDEDSWGFTNSPRGFDYPSDYKIPEARYAEVFGEEYVIAAKSGDEKHYKSMIDPVWGGNCLGMSSSSILFNLGILDMQDFNDLKQFSCLNAYYGRLDYNIKSSNAKNMIYNVCGQSIRELIESYQILQIADDPYKSKFGPSSTYNSVFKNFVGSITSNERPHLPNGSYVSDLLNKINNTDIPLVISMYTNRGGHAMVLRTDVKPVDEGNGWYKVYIYDPNVPHMYEEYMDCANAQHEYIGEDSGYPYMEFNPTQNKWRYVCRNTYSGCDSQGNLKYLKWKLNGEDELFRMPEFVFLWSPSLYPAEFDGSGSLWYRPEGEQTEIMTSQNSTFNVYSANNELLCVVVNGDAFAVSDDVTVSSSAGLLADGENTVVSRVFVPNKDFRIEYKDGDDITMINDDTVINLSCDGELSADIAMDENKVELSGLEESNVTAQISDFSIGNNDYTQVYAEGNINEDDIVSFSLVDDSLTSNSTLCSESTFDVFTRNEDIPTSRLLGSVTEDTGLLQIDDVRDLLAEYDIGDVVTTADLDAGEKEGYVFLGWYDSEGSDATPYGETFVVEEETQVYPKWKAIGAVTVERDDIYTSYGETRNAVSGFGLVGAQIRFIKDDSLNGLRFVSRLSNDLINTLEMLDKSDNGSVEYGHIVSTALTSADTLDDSTGRRVVANNKLYDGERYKVFSAVIASIPQNAYNREISARPYIEYTDANGTARLHMFTETEARNYNGAYHTTISRVAKYIIDNDFLRYSNSSAELKEYLSGLASYCND